MSNLNEISQRAADEGVSKILSEDYEDYHALEPWSEQNPQLALVPTRYSVENRVVDYTEVQPNAGFNSAGFLNSSTTDFRLDSSDVSVIDHAFLAVSLTNATGAAVTLAPPAFWFERIEILGPNSNVLTTITDVNSWLSMCMLPRSEFEQLAALIGTSAAYSTAGTTYANGVSGELYLPLLTLIHAARLHLPGISGPLTFRFTAKPAAMTLVAGTHPTINRIVLLLGGFDEPQTQRTERTNVLLGRPSRTFGRSMSRTPIFAPFHGWENWGFSQALQPSARAELRLNGLRGQFTALFVAIRSASMTAANQGTLVRMDSLHVQDSSGAIMCGNHVKSHDRSRIIAAAQMSNLSAQNVNYYLIPFSGAVVSDFFIGSNHGFQVFSGNESLVLTPPSTLVAGNYKIDVCAVRSQALRMQGGSIDIRK